MAKPEPRTSATYHTTSVVYDPTSSGDVTTAGEIAERLREAGVDVFFQGDAFGAKLHVVAREAEGSVPGRP